MISFKAFSDEIQKMAAMKSRKGSPPIKVHNLVGKESYEGGNGKTVKLAKAKALGEAAKSIGALVKKHKVPIGAFVAGVGGKQAYEDWKIGRRVRAAQRR